MPITRTKTPKATVPVTKPLPRFDPFLREYADELRRKGYTAEIRPVKRRPHEAVLYRSTHPVQEIR